MPGTHARRLRSFGWRPTWGRWLALFVLVFALPASEHVIRELVSVACEAAGDGCADGCDDDVGVCLDGCGHCTCCQPPVAPWLAALSVSVAPSQHRSVVLPRIEDPPAGVFESLFRPPTA